MTHAPGISIIIPLYNKEKYIGRAVRSALAQSVPNFEIIVVDDGSTDRGLGLVAEIEDPRLRLLRQDHRGVSAARNRGIAHARADLVAFLDADDEWVTEFLETILRLRASFPAAQVFGTGYVYVYDDGYWRLPYLRPVLGESWEGVLEDYFRVAATSDPPLCASAVAATRTALQAVHGFEETIASGEDLLTWARLAIRYPIAYSTRRLSLYHLGETSTAPLLPRLPQEPDRVGAELRRLLHSVEPQRRKWLRRYIGLWDKIQASALLQRGRPRSALRWCAAAVWRRPMDRRLYVYLLLGLLPAGLSQQAFVRMRRAAERRRLRHGAHDAAPWPTGTRTPLSEGVS